MCESMCWVLVMLFDLSDLFMSVCVVIVRVLSVKVVVEKIVNVICYFVSLVELRLVVMVIVVRNVVCLKN